MAVASVRTARGLREHTDFLLRQAEGLRDLLAHAERPMRPDVHRRAVAADIGDRGARSDRRVGDRREHVGLPQTQRRAAQLLVDSGVGAHGDFGRRSFDGNHVPLGLDRSCGGARLLLALGNDPDDVALAHDGDDPGHRSGFGVVE